MIRGIAEGGSRLAYSQKIEKNNREKSDTQIKKEEKIQQADRVSQIREEIQNGTYKLDMKKTSEKMAQNLLNL